MFYKQCLASSLRTAKTKKYWHTLNGLQSNLFVELAKVTFNSIYEDNTDLKSNVFDGNGL